MSPRVLAAGLGVILVSAVVYALLGTRVETPPPPEFQAPPSAAPTLPPGPRVGSPAPSDPVPAPVPRDPTVTAPPPAAPPAPALPAHPTTLGNETLSGGTSSGNAAQAGAFDAGVPFKLDKDGIKSAITEKIPELKQCYEDWLQANPSLAGRIKVGFTIDEDPQTGLGSVTQIEVADGGMGHFAMEGCVMNVFKGLTFEAPRNGPVRVNYPLNFSAGDGG